MPRPRGSICGSSRRPLLRRRRRRRRFRRSDHALFIYSVLFSSIQFCASVSMGVVRVACLYSRRSARRSASRTARTSRTGPTEGVRVACQVLAAIGSGPGPLGVCGEQRPRRGLLNGRHIIGPFPGPLSDLFAALPRPPGRGPIEAQLPTVLPFTSKHPFRDLRVAAPLKLVFPGVCGGAVYPFRDLRVAAPLKLFILG